MAFVNIIKGDNTIRVTRSSFENYFKSNGYKIIDTEKEYALKVNNEPSEEEELETIPISDMNKEQLKLFATSHGIDTSRAKNVNEARKIIREEMEKRKM